MLNDADRSLLLTLPLPLAQAWRRALYAGPPIESHERALYTLEATLKYAASVAAAGWTAGGGVDVPAREACEALVRPSLGQWEAILRACLPALSESGMVAAWLARLLARKIGVTVPGLDGRSVGRVFEALPAYRNAVVHGAGLPQQEAAQRAPRLMELSREVLGAVVNESAPTLFGCAGSATVRLAGVGAVVERGNATQASGAVWLEANGRAVSLSPLWIFDPDKDDVLVLNKGAGLPKVEYLSYGVSRGGTGLSVWKGAVAAEAARFLKAATGRADLEMSHVMALVEETEVRALADRASSRWIGPYRIIRRVARGGQGVLYEAIQEDPPRRVALKVLPQQAATDELARRRFHEEAATLARVEHPGVVPVYAAGEHEGVPWIAMRYVEGRDLAEVIRLLPDRGPSQTTVHDWRQAAGIESSGDHTPPPRSHANRMAAIGRDLARALAACHEQGVVHRDVKPANVMVDAEGRVLLTDFGLARVTEPRTRTQTRRMVGTLHYLAPEALLPSRKSAPDARVDVYGLGATLYELLTQRRPFADHEGDDAALMLAVQVKDPPPLRKTAPTVPRDLEVIVAKAMDKDPERRYRTAADMADDLDRFLRQEPIHARPAGRVLRLRRWTSRHPALTALMLAAAVALPLLAVFGGYLYVSWERIERDKLAEREAGIERRLERALIDYSEMNLRDAREAFEAILQEKPDAVLALAGLALTQYEWEAALHVLRARPALLERFPDVRRIVALALSRLGRGAEAARVTAEIPPVNSSIGYFLAALEANRANLNDHAQQKHALHLLSRAAVASRKPRAIFHLFGARIAGIIQDQAAVRGIADALELRWPDSHQAWLCIGFALTRIDDFERGLPACRKAVELDPDSALARIELGDALTRRIRYAGKPEARSELDASTLRAILEEAIAAYDKAISLRPELATAHCNRGAALAEQGRHKEAMESLREAIRLEPKLHRAWFNLGRILELEGENAKAVEAYRRAIRLGRPEIHAHINLGHALAREGQTQAAAEALREAIRVPAQPRLHAVAHYNLGLVLALEGNDRLAVDSFRDAVRAWPKLQTAWQGLIGALLNLNRTRAAVEAYREAGAPRLDQTPVGYRMGRILYATADYKAAAKVFADVVAREPGHWECQGTLGCTLMALGRYRDALPHLKKAVESPVADERGSPFGSSLDECKAMANLEPLLERVLAGEDQPDSAREAYWLAMIASQRRHLLAAADLYRTALRASVRLPTRRGLSARFLAARAASAGAGGQGVGARKTDELARTAWRIQAVRWLREELDAVLQKYEEGEVAEQALHNVLRAWLEDSDLAFVRDVARQTGWTFAERATSAQLWAEIQEAVDG